MKPAAIVDVVGVAMVATFAALPLSCVPQVPLKRENLQPLVAAAGAYAVMEADAAPAPPVPTVGCEAGCRCSGTGKERSGDGLELVGCRCPDTCSCKSARVPTVGVPTAAPVTTDGRPGWAPKNTHH